MEKLLGLEFKVTAVLGSIVLIAALTIAIMAFALDQARTNERMGAQVSQLQILSQGVFRRSGNYLGSAPRSYPAYNRDLIIFYPDFMADLGAMGRLIEGIHGHYFDRARALALGPQDIGLRDPGTDQLVTGVHDNWTTFFAGLRDKLGDDPNEPRLEWGTEYIRDHQAELRENIDALIVRINARLVEQNRKLKSASSWAMGLLALLAALSILWFYFGVTRRIKRAVAGCVQVSTGDFGHQIRVKGRDEIAVLGSAINKLSERARLVLSLTGQMRGASGPRSALEEFWDTCETPFSLNALSLHTWVDGGRALQLLHALPDGGNRTRRRDVRTQHFVKGLLREGKPEVIVDPEQFMAAHPTERLVRDLTLKGEGSRALLILPLLDKGATWGVLFMTSADPEAFTSEHVALLENLSPVFSQAFRPPATAVESAPAGEAAEAAG